MNFKTNDYLTEIIYALLEGRKQSTEETLQKEIVRVVVEWLDTRTASLSMVGSREKDDAQRIGTTGGIDLMSADKKIQTQNGGGAIKFHVDPAMLKQLQNSPGFFPEIMSIQRMTDVRGFLGVS